MTKRPRIRRRGHENNNNNSSRVINAAESFTKFTHDKERKTTTCWINYETFRHDLQRNVELTPTYRINTCPSSKCDIYVQQSTAQNLCGKDECDVVLEASNQWFDAGLSPWSWTTRPRTTEKDQAIEWAGRKSCTCRASPRNHSNKTQPRNATLRLCIRECCLHFRSASQSVAGAGSV